MSTRSSARAVVLAAQVAGIVGPACAALRAVVSPAGPDGPPRASLNKNRWVRSNYRGRPVSLAGGPALAVVSLAAIAADDASPARVRSAALIAGAAALLCGSYDDLHGSSTDRGLTGHLRALRAGRLTTGAVKVAALASSGMVAGALGERGTWSRKLAAGALIAASANVANLLDLRPGRAAKAGLAVAAPIVLGGGAGSRVAGVAAGAAAGLLPLDLDEQVMLGDAGANTLGALIGVAIVAGGGRRMPIALAIAVALTVASEAISFSRVIESRRLLRWFDELGRRTDA